MNFKNSEVLNYSKFLKESFYRFNFFPKPIIQLLSSASRSFSHFKNGFVNRLIVDPTSSCDESSQNFPSSIFHSFL